MNAFWDEMGIELFHRFAPKPDFKGVHDTVGKEDRRWINRNVTRDRVLVPQLPIPSGEGSTPRAGPQREQQPPQPLQEASSRVGSVLYRSWTCDLPGSLESDTNCLVCGFFGV